MFFEHRAVVDWARASGYASLPVRVAPDISSSSLSSSLPSSSFPAPSYESFTPSRGAAIDEEQKFNLSVMMMSEKFFNSSHPVHTSEQNANSDSDTDDDERYEDALGDAPQFSFDTIKAAQDTTSTFPPSAVVPPPLLLSSSFMFPSPRESQSPPHQAVSPPSSPVQTPRQPSQLSASFASLKSLLSSRSISSRKEKKRASKFSKKRVRKFFSSLMSRSSSTIPTGVETSVQEDTSIDVDRDKEYSLASSSSPPFPLSQQQQMGQALSFESARDAAVLSKTASAALWMDCKKRVGENREIFENLHTATVEVPEDWKIVEREELFSCQPELTFGLMALLFESQASFSIS